LFHLASELKKYRKYRGLTQSEVADGICSRHYVVKIENGTVIPSAKVFVALCDRLQCPLSGFLEAYLDVQHDPHEISQLAVLLAKRGLLQRGFSVVKKTLMPAAPRGRLLYLWAQMLAAAGHPDAALELYRRAIGSLADNDLVDGLFNAAKCAKKIGRLVEAHRLYAEALTHANASRSTDRGLKSRILLNMANVEFSLGSYSSAASHYNETLTLARAGHDVEMQIAALIGISICYLAQDRYAEAAGLLEDSVVLCNAVGQTDLIPTVYNNLAIAKRHLGRTDEALHLLGESIRLNHAMKLEQESIYSLNELTEIHIDLGKLKEAAEYNKEALGLLPGFADFRERTLTYKLAAKLAIMQQSWEQALQFAKEALDSLNPYFGAQRGEIICLAAEICLAMGQHEQAAAYCRDAAKLFEALGKEESMM